MKKMLMTLGAFMAMAIVPMVAWADRQACIQQGVIIRVDDEPKITKNAWSIYVYDPVHQDTLWLTSDPGSSINVSRPKGSAVFALAMAAYTAQSLVSVYDNTGSFCGSFDEIVLEPVPPPDSQ